MQRKQRGHLGLPFMLVAVLWAGSAMGAAAGDSASISPTHISLGQSAELRLPARAGASSVVPKVDGLSFERRGQSDEMSSVNGVVARHSWILYEVVPERTGHFSIPVGAQSLALEVGPAAATSPGSVPGQGRGTPSPASATSAPPEASRGPLAFLRVGLPKRKIFVGETVPVTFRAYFRAGTEVTVSGAPSLGIPAFTISDLDDSPKQGDKTIGGVPYRVATWTGRATAAMTGRFTAHGELPIVARYRTAPAQPKDHTFGSIFDDDDDLFAASPSAMMRSLMQRMPLGGLDDMFGQVREREMTLRAPAVSVEVQGLPSAGRPADFHGAVGNLTLRTSLTPSSGTAFAPMALAIEVKGQGNLDRVSLAGLATSADWRTYPPSAKTTAQGSKLFEQAVVPQRSGRLEIPAISLSFFDPDQKKYITRSSSPLAVEVAAAAPGSAAPVAAAARPPTAPQPTSGLRPNRIDEGHFVSTLLPPYRRSWFWPVVALPWLALVGMGAGPRMRRPSARARRRATQETVTRHRMEMKSAVAEQDAVRFYQAAATALRIQWGQRWRLDPDEVTAAEAAARSGPEDAPMVEVLRVAERVRYGGAVVAPASLADLQAAIEHKLKQLEGRP
jgi:hypothetical protein